MQHALNLIAALTTAFHALNLDVGPIEVTQDRATPDTDIIRVGETGIEIAEGGLFGQKMTKDGLVDATHPTWFATQTTTTVQVGNPYFVEGIQVIEEIRQDEPDAMMKLATAVAIHHARQRVLNAFTTVKTDGDLCRKAVALQAEARKLRKLADVFDANATAIEDTLSRLADLIHGR